MSSSGSTAPPVDSLLYYITIVQCANCSTGLLLNGFLLYTILRNKELRSSCCSLFIMLLASFDWINEFSLATLPTILTLSRTTIPLFVCFFVGSYGTYIFYNMIAMLLTISIDRLISIVMPIKYRFLSRRYKWKYVLVAVLLPAVGLVPFTIYQYYIYCMSQPNLQVYCQPSDMMGLDGKNYGFSINVWADVAIFLVYFCIFLLIRCKVVKISPDDKVDRRISRSIFVLMAITLFFALPAPLFVQYILPTMKITDDQTSNGIYRGVIQLSKFTQALNGPVLYFCSADYRSAIQKEWTNLFGGHANVNTSSTQQLNSQVETTNLRRINTVAPKSTMNPSPDSLRGQGIVQISS